MDLCRSNIFQKIKMENIDSRAPLLTESTGSCSLFKACFNGTSAFLGIGLIAIPYALSRAGWLSLVLCLLIAIMTYYTAFLLKKCTDSDQSIKSYLDIAERAFDRRGRNMASFFLNTEMYLVATGLMISESDNLYYLFPNFAIDFGPLVIGGRESFVLITTLVISPTMMMTDLSVLSYVSATGVFSTLVIVVSLVCVGVFGGVGFQASGVLLNASGIPTAVSLYIFCFAGHPVIPSIYISMRKRDQFGKVLFVIYFLSTITYMVTAVTGYLMFGANTESQISLNLQTTEISAQIAIYTVLLIPVTRYALTVTPVANVIEDGLRSYDGNHSRLLGWLIRLGLLGSSTLVAYVFPYFENLMSLAASIFTVFASFLLPCLCYLKLSNCYRNWNYKLISSVGITLFGTLAGALGTYSSIAELL